MGETRRKSLRDARMGLNPMISRQAQTFAFLFSPWRAPPGALHPYRASGLVLAQIAVRTVRRTGKFDPERPFKIGP